MASTKATTAGEEGEQSYSSMNKDEVDMESIGAHCQFAYCHQLDFLPFRCESCHGTYCLDHRTETTHQCSKAGTWAAGRRKKSMTGKMPATTTTIRSTVENTSKPCAQTQCKTPIHTSLNLGVHCPTCNREYCLKHRFRDDHDCANVVPLGARPSGGGSSSSSNILTTQRTAATEKAKLAISKLKSWGSKSKTTTTTTTATNPNASRIMALNELKREAKGDTRLPPEKRIYVHIEGSSSNNTSSSSKSKVFFDRDWSIGRVLDAAAKELQMANVNNHGGGEDDRLRIFHVEGGRMLPFGEKLGQAVGSGNTLVLLRGVGEELRPLI